MTTYKEEELIIPAVEILANQGEIKTSTLIKELTKKLLPSGYDLRILKGRSDTSFSQKVRNLKSHNTLENKGFAKYNEHTKTWKLTPDGKMFCKENKEEFDYLIENKFKNIGSKNKIIYVEEGREKYLSQKTKIRSAKLRKFAIKYFIKRDAGLICEACGFNFLKKYGERGNGFMEIHHRELVSEIDSYGNKIDIKEAIKKVSPLCSNCHRMIHRKRTSMLSIKELKEIIKNS